MLTSNQATAVAGYLIAHIPGASGELDHSDISAWQMACDALEALGYAKEAPRGARLLHAPALPAVLPRWDDACCVVLSVGVQTGGIRLKHPRSDLTDETGPSTADQETAALLAELGLISDGAWTDVAVPILWRTALEEVRPPNKKEFSVQVGGAVTDIPDAIRGQIYTIYADHNDQFVRNHLIDWVFFEVWRWGDGWLTDDSRGRPLRIFHDLLAQRVRSAVLPRLIAV